MSDLQRWSWPKRCLEHSHTSVRRNGERSKSKTKQLCDRTTDPNHIQTISNSFKDQQLARSFDLFPLRSSKMPSEPFGIPIPRKPLPNCTKPRQLARLGATAPALSVQTGSKPRQAPGMWRVFDESQVSCTSFNIAILDDQLVRH